MGTITTYALEGPVATVTMDDGKANALSPVMLSELHDSVDRAREAGAALVLAGRPGRFSAGFHLPTLSGGGAAAADLLLAGFELAEKLLSHPRPVVIACTGHALAMGSFLLVSGDLRIGAAGDFRIGANEVAIGLTMPRTAIELCRQRLATPYLSRAMVNAEIFDPDGAAAAGFLDRVVPGRRGGRRGLPGGGGPGRAGRSRPGRHQGPTPSGRPPCAPGRHRGGRRRDAGAVQLTAGAVRSGRPPGPASCCRRGR